MIKFENIAVYGWEEAIRGMRNPMNSWDKIDSGYCNTLSALNKEGCDICPIKDSDPSTCYEKNPYIIGPNDLDLMNRLRNAGTDHRKFMRMIVVYTDINAPLYWWKEFDTYKIGTVANSCSTMHKIHAKEFTLDDFSCEHLIDEVDEEHYNLWRSEFKIIIAKLNHARERYLETKNKKYWWQMIQLLPTSYNQKRTVMMNYEVLANIYKSRKNHKLDEWSKGFMDWIKTLPYSELITGEKQNESNL